MAAEQIPSGKTSSLRTVGDVATVAVGVGLLSFVCIACIGVLFGLFTVGSFVAVLLSPWAIFGVPVVGYLLWRWQRYRLRCRIDNSRAADNGRDRSQSSTT